MHGQVDIAKPAGGVVPTLRSRLFRIILATSMPLVLLFGLKGYLDYRASREEVVVSTMAIARELAQALDAQLDTYVVALRSLALSGSLTRDERGTFIARANVFLTNYPAARLAVATPDGRVIYSIGAGLVIQAPADVHVATSCVSQAVANAAPVVSDFHIGVYSRQPTFSVCVPVWRDGQIAYALVLNPLTKALAGLVAPEHLPQGWNATIHDSQGNILARTFNAERVIGDRASPDFRATVLGRREGTYFNVNLDGMKVQSAFLHIAKARWSVAVGVPEAQLRAPLWHSVSETGALAVVALLLALMAAFAMTRRVLQPVGALVRWAADPGTVPPPPLGLREADALAAYLQRALAGRAALASEMHRLVATSPIGIFRAQAGDLLTDANAAFLGLVGAEDGELRQGTLRLQLMTPPECHATVLAALTQARQRGACEPSEMELYHRDGRRVPALIALALLDPAADLFAGFALDLTRLRQAEAALQASEQRLRLSQEVAGIGTWDWDIPRDTVHWSAEQFRLYGIDPATGSTQAAWFDAMHPDDRERARADARAALDGQGQFESTFRIVLPPAHGGAVRWIYGRGVVFRDAAGRPVRMLGVNMDVTERRAAEQRLRDLAETQEARIEQEVRAREEAQTRLAQTQRLEALGQLAGGIAHDFNNILQALLAGLGVILHRRKDPVAVQRFVGLCEDAVRRGTAITGRLLTFSHSGALQPQPIAIAALLENLSDMLAPTLGTDVTIGITAAASLPPVLADRNQLETALINLAVNARHAMPEGGRLSIAAVAEGPGASPQRLSIPCIRLDIADTGSGMDAGVLARASEPFFTTKPVGKGTGLGLAMVRGFVEQSGGHFAIASAPGQGTIVTLWLPQADLRTAPASGQAREGEPSLLRDARLLLVDDDALVRAGLASGLEDLGYQVCAMADGQAALDWLDANTPPDLLITDQTMPGMNGLTLIEKCRARLPNLPVLLLTGHTEPLDLTPPLPGDPPLRLLRKPVARHDLAAAVAGLLALHEPA